MSLTDDQRREVDDRIELFVRRYFDHYLNEVLPRTLAEAFKLHDQGCGAHGGIVKRFTRFKWLLIGLVGSGGLGFGFGLIKFLRSL